MRRSPFHREKAFGKMVKLPEPSRPAPRPFIRQRTQLLHDYGAFLTLWSEFELLLEVKIAELTGLQPVDASIVLGTLGFGTKPLILEALLHERGSAELMEKVNAAISHAKRNALVHSLVASEHSPPKFAFARRDLGRGYRVRHTTFNDESFNKHFETFRKLYKEAQDALGIQLEDMEEYARSARIFEQK